MNEKSTGTVRTRLDPENMPPLTSDESKQLEAMRTMRDEDIDYSDLPSGRNLEWMKPARTVQGPIETVRLEADVLEFFKADRSAPDEKHINDALREYISTHRKAS